MGTVDLHVHSYVSDGTLSPAEIAEAAGALGLAALAIADHNLAGAYKEARPMCDRLGIRLIPAAEIDALEGDRNVHVLAYGFDPADAEFLAFLSHVRFLLDEVSAKLIERMGADYAGVSFGDYMDFAHDPRGGGWKALSYFVARGVAPTLKAGIGLYGRYGLTHGLSGYPAARSVAWHVHRAGGRAILAHAGETFDGLSRGAFRAELSRLLDSGLDGIECFYPTHGEEITEACLSLCGERGLLVTAGSDFHGEFGNRRLGELGIDEGRISPIRALDPRGAAEGRYAGDG
ncbi:MAG: PHP domain-containing protein [Promicromonosporaceae bacterium]|nr:PHP domain-containing protein [Promicromonosporaceae bacterium]